MLHFETVLDSTLDLLKELQSNPELSGMRLVGGTALALQLGHRTSVDLDLFGTFNPTRSFRRILMDNGHLADGAENGESEIAFALRGLTYYDDAETDPMPKMFSSLTWEESKSRLLKAVRDFVKFE